MIKTYLLLFQKVFIGNVPTAEDMGFKKINKLHHFGNTIIVVNIYTVYIGIKAKMFKFEARVLIDWLVQSIL